MGNLRVQWLKTGSYPRHIPGEGGGYSATGCYSVTNVYKVWLTQYRTKAKCMNIIWTHIPIIVLIVM